MYIPDKLYHATIKSRIASIKKYGLGAIIPKKRFWDYDGTCYANITIGCFLDSDINCAFDYIDSSDYFDGDENNIVVFEIDTNDLDLSKLTYDRNDEKNINDNGLESHSYFYKGIIPYDNLRKLKNNEIFEIMNNTDLYNAIMEKIAVIVKTTLNEKEEKLEPYEKMDAWHNGERDENIGACSAEKLRSYLTYCKAAGYDREVNIINNELKKRGLKHE